MIKKKVFFVFLVLNIFLANAQNNTYFTPYARLYPDFIPNAMPTSDTMYATPKDIVPFISLKDIGATIKYFPNGTEYVEKELHGVKGRLFLRVVKGALFSVRDIRFMPYKVEESYVDLLKQAQGYIDEKKLQIIKNEKIEKNNKMSIPVQMNTKIKKSSVNTFHIIKYTKGEYSVPLQYEENNSFSFILDIILFKNSKRKILKRYINGENAYTETYKYTTKGALRMLIRKYVDGTMEQFLYYFTSGGIEEVFHREKNGESYKQRFTESGELKQQEKSDAKGVVVYNLENTFDKKGHIIEQTITDFKKKRKTIVYYNDGKKKEVNTYHIERKENEVQQVLIESSHYDYNSTSQVSKKESESIANEKVLKSILDKDGNLIKTQEFIDGILFIEIKEKGNNKHIKTFFLNGKPVIRVYYKGKYKEREEVINNGVVIERREQE